MADKRQLVLIVWRDHYTSGNWKTLEEFQALEPDINRSVGWVVAESDDRITVVQTVGDTFVRDSITLEKSCIEKVHKLKVPVA